MSRNKKRAAAVSAVLAYIREEEAQGFSSDAAPRQPIVIPNVWGINGRQSQMHLRNMMQLKGFHGARLR
jgi:hypothetical protein